MVDETKVNCMKQRRRIINWWDCTKDNLLRILLTASWRSPTSRQEGRSGVTSCRGKWPPLGFLLLLYCQLDGFVYNVTASVRHPEAVMLQPTWVKQSMVCLPFLLLLTEIHYPLKAITGQWAKREGFDTAKIMVDARLCMWTAEDLFGPQTYHWTKCFGSLQPYLIFVTSTTSGAHVNFFWPV